LDTVTSTVDGAWTAGLVAVIVVPDITVNDPADLFPNHTAVALRKSEPEIVTTVPPATAPLAGATPLTVGGAGTANVNLNWSPAVTALVPLVVETVTSTVPAYVGGVTAVMDVGDDTKYDAAG
jgi:hypothetical protein